MQMACAVQAHQGTLDPTHSLRVAFAALPAQILESEGQRQSKINVAEGRKVEVVLASEGAREDAINRATGASCRSRCGVCCPGRVRPRLGLPNARTRTVRPRGHLTGSSCTLACV